MRRLTLAILAAALASGGLGHGTGQSFASPASADTETLVREALEDRLATSDIADLRLLGGAKRMAIRDDMPRAQLKLSAGALPHREGYEFYLISEKAAQAEADRTGQLVFFITADQPSITDGVATLWLGTDVTIPTDSRKAKTCCCRRLGQFRRSDGRWTFVKWLDWICS